MNAVPHGGRLDEAVSRFGGHPTTWLDLSTGINANSYPVPEISKRAWARLPDSEAKTAAEMAVRKAYFVPQEAEISLGAGTQAHIQNLPSLFKPQAVAIVGYTYQEHGVCWQRAGHEVYVTDGLESAEATARIIIVVNPNNPDGKIYDREALVSLSRRLATKGGLLVVDEAFGEVVPNASVLGESGREGLVVLRSLGKFFGLAGVRFGAAIGSASLIRRLEERLGPWAVSGPALEVASVALGDTKWQKRTSKKLAAGREQLETLLQKHGHEIVGGTDLFVLSQVRDADQLRDHLATEHILVRGFVGKSRWIRFGVPGGKAAFTRLDKALSSMLV